MSLSIGIVGLPNVGKSTLFTALTNKGGLAANYPFATIEPNVGVVPVPDARLDALAKIDHPAKIVPASVEFVDIAGLVAGASQGEGLGNQFLANIRETDAICEVVRFFTDPDVVHVAGKVNPASDVETIKTELILADMATLDKALPRLDKESKRDKAGAKKVELVKRVLEGLNEGHRARTLGLTEDEQAALADLHLLTMKP
ncbi:MAG: GTPase, partial [Raoultibacter sp.]